MKPSILVVLALYAPTLAGCAGFGFGGESTPAKPAAAAAATPPQAVQPIAPVAAVQAQPLPPTAPDATASNSAGPVAETWRRPRLGATDAPDTCGHRGVVAAGALACFHSHRSGAGRRPRRTDRRVADGGRSAGRMERANCGAGFRAEPLVAGRARRLRIYRARGRDRRRLPRLFADDLRRRTAESQPGRRLQAGGRDLEDDELDFSRDLGRVLR